jgi:hypothetical protein
MDGTRMDRRIKQSLFCGVSGSFEESTRNSTEGENVLRKEITPAIVAEIEELLAAGFTSAEIAAYFEISRYVVEVVAHDDENRDHPAPPRRRAGFKEPKEQIDHATVRMIERLLGVGLLSYPEIAREVGVSKNTICAIATGRRAAIALARPRLNVGETFMPQPIRCSACGGRLTVVPCRACQARSGSWVPRNWYERLSMDQTSSTDDRQKIAINVLERRTIETALL